MRIGGEALQKCLSLCFPCHTHTRVSYLVRDASIAGSGGVTGGLGFDAVVACLPYILIAVVMIVAG